MPKSVILALDQGTTSSRAILYDAEGRQISSAQRVYPQIYPETGWVEHEPDALFESQLLCAREALHTAGIGPAEVTAIGIANQRETTLVWERATGRPIYPAIVWQDRRTAAECERLRSGGVEPMVTERTGLLLDPYFSATKAAWILDHVPGARRRAERGELAFGTVDTYLVWRLTGGRTHVTDVSNASRTLLFNLSSLDWDDELCTLFRIPREMLPSVVSSSGLIARTDAADLGAEVEICGVAGDQQAATFGQTCFGVGDVKNTYGTGSFLLMNVGDRPTPSRHRLLSTVAWRLGESKTQFAIEGSIFVTGAAVQWLRDGLGIIGTADEVEALAASVLDSGGVTFVPAFVGLGAPYWDPDARGAIMGITRGTGRAHIVRAALEAACFQTRDVVEAMQADSGTTLASLRVDGGMAANNVMLQTQADLLGIPVERPVDCETTALGAAYLAGLGAGVWRSKAELAAGRRIDRVFEPSISSDERNERYSAWQDAVRRCRGRTFASEPDAL